jgi:hypothetical protein
MSIQALGWIATAVFSTSYFFRSASLLRRIQAGAAALWICYGLAIGAAPVVVANAIVAVAALAAPFISRLRPRGRANESREGRTLLN